MAEFLTWNIKESIPRHSVILYIENIVKPILCIFYSKI